MKTSALAITCKKDTRGPGAATGVREGSVGNPQLELTLKDKCHGLKFRVLLFKNKPKLTKPHTPKIPNQKGIEKFCYQAPACCWRGCSGAKGTLTWWQRQHWPGQGHSRDSRDAGTRQGQQVSRDTAGTAGMQGHGRDRVLLARSTCSKEPVARAEGTPSLCSSTIAPAPSCSSALPYHPTRNT